MARAKARGTPAEARRASPLPAPHRIVEAFQRLGSRNALQTLVRAAVPNAVLKRLLKDALPARAAKEVPREVWPSLAIGLAVEAPLFGLALARELHDRLAWDREPATLDDWWRVVRERPLEALWMAALSETKAVRKELAHIIEHCVENVRASPTWEPPSWEFVEGVLAVQAEAIRDLREAEKKAEDAERRNEAERERLEELREELKRLRRENGGLRGEKAQAERRAAELEARFRDEATADDARRAEELDRRLRKAEKEREHLSRELERIQASAAPTSAQRAPAPEAVDEDEVSELPAHAQPSLSEDPNPRRRVLRQMLRKLVKKGKIGASHTHQDNVYRGVADHEKGIAKEAIDLLYREGLLVPKPTVTDPHVSLSPDRVPEVRAIIAGEIANPRLQRFVGE